MFQIDAEIERPHEIDGEIEGPEIKMNRPNLQDRTVAPSYGTQTITPSIGYDGLGTVIVEQFPNAEEAVF